MVSLEIAAYSLCLEPRTLGGRLLPCLLDHHDLHQVIYSLQEIIFTSPYCSEFYVISFHFYILLCFYCVVNILFLKLLKQQVPNKLTKFISAEC